MLAVHTTEDGNLLICYWCRTGDCSDSVVHGMPEDVVCHCSCQSKCKQKSCQRLAGTATPPGTTRL